MSGVDSFRFLSFVGLLCFLGTLETFFGFRKWEEKRFKRWFFHGLLAIFNTLLLRILTAGPLVHLNFIVHQNGWGLLGTLPLSGLMEIGISLIVLDFFDYWWHRSNHAVSFLWRFHKVHHVDTHLDVTTALRFHPGELLISSGLKAFLILFLGPSPLSFALFEIVLSSTSLFHHSNFTFPKNWERVLITFLVTPRYHTSHHTVSGRSREANYSTSINLWDKLFGSYRRPDVSEMQQLGLPKGRLHTLKFRHTFLGPFVEDY